MNPFLIALIAPVLWAIANHIDKYLLSRFEKGNGAGALILVSALYSLFIIPTIFIFAPYVVDVQSQSAFFMVFVGFMYGISIMLYLYALQDEEATIVVPFFQLIPVFGYIFGAVFLSEYLTLIQIISGLLIVVGSCMLSLEKNEEGGYGIKWKLIALMISSVIIIAATDVGFKSVALEIGFWETAFWNYVGLLSLGILLFTLYRPYRREFLDMMKENGIKITSLNFGNETMTMIGEMVLAFAMLSAPVVLIQLTVSYQPVVVFIIGILMTLYLPKIAEEDMSRPSLIHKITSISLMLIGTILLLSS